MTKDLIAETTKKLLEIDKTIKQLDPAIRSSAFDIIAPMFFENTAPAQVAEQRIENTTTNPTSINHDDKESFFSSYDHGKPKDNVLLIVAWLYSQYGKFAITRADIEKEGNEAGLTIPTRPDNTMKQAKHNSKSLFIKKGKGYELTVSGETHIKEIYGVKKGNKGRPTAE